MTKKNSFVAAFVWACNTLDTEQLSIAEQATLFNLLKLINRNFWKPIKISAYKLSRTMCCDTRTIQKALKNLADKKIILKEGDMIYLGHISQKQFQSLISESLDKSDNEKLRNADGDNKPDKPSDSPSVDSKPQPESKTLADFG